MRSLRGLLRFLRPYRRWALLAPLLMVLEVGLDLVQPRLIQRIVDVGVAQADMAVVLHTGMAMVGVALLAALCGMGCTVFAVLASEGFGADLRQALFSKVQSLSFANTDQFDTGSLVTRLTNDVNQTQNSMAMLLRIMVRGPLMLVGSLVMAIVTGPRLAPLFLVLIPLVTLVIVVIIRRAFPLFRQVQDKVDGLNTVMQENLMGVRVVKAFVRGPREEERFGQANRELMTLAVKAARTVAVGWPLMMFILQLGVAAVLWFGGRHVIAGTMQIGQIIAFVNYLFGTLFSLVMVSMLVMSFSRAEASARRIEEVLISQPAVRNRPQTLQALPSLPGAATGDGARVRGRLALEGVTFAYDGDDHEPVLRDVDLVAEPGQRVALLGATGAGKSSLVHLIPRFYDVQKGRVTLDGVDVRDLDLHLLRRNVVIALQEPILFTGTIRDNIRYGRTEATDTQVEEAARLAQAHEFIAGFAAGYDTEVGQRGVNLSGGQKQRIAIARALLVDPAVLILDDSTSSVDVETEAAIQMALAEFAAGGGSRPRTVILIAQRISTVLDADQILVLDGGRIAAAGTHADLLATSDIYREIHDSQLGEGAACHG